MRFLLRVHGHVVLVVGVVDGGEVALRALVRLVVLMTGEHMGPQVVPASGYVVALRAREFLVVPEGNVVVVKNVL